MVVVQILNAGGFRGLVCAYSDVFAIASSMLKTSFGCTYIHSFPGKFTVTSGLFLMAIK
jgi:hypothetical protein